MEVVEVVLAQTKKQAVKTTTEWNLFIGLVRRMDHESNCKKIEYSRVPPKSIIVDRDKRIERLMSPPIKELLYVTACFLHYRDMELAMLYVGEETRHRNVMKVCKKS